MSDRPLRASTTPSASIAERCKAATQLAEAIGECDPRDAIQIMDAAIADLAIGAPLPPLFDFESQAEAWSSWASQTELCAYIRATWRHLDDQHRRGFLEDLRARK